MKHFSLAILTFIWTQLYYYFNAPVHEQAPFARQEPFAHSSSTTLFDIESVYRAETDDHPLPTDLTAQIPNVMLPKDECSDPSFKPILLHTNRPIRVTIAMKKPLKPNRVFFMLNGRNKGYYVSYNERFECMHTSAKLAAIALGADANLVENGIRLYTQLGFPIRGLYRIQQFKSNCTRLDRLSDLDGVVMTTVGLSPKVFDVEYFISANESAKLVELGSPSLERSQVVGSEGGSVMDDARTSHTSYLPQSDFTRKFQNRGARVARLPSPSFIEGLQLVRYNAGEFYRRHLDTFSSMSFKPNEWTEYTYRDFLDWVSWSVVKIRELGPRVPEDFRYGGRYYPNVNDTTGFHVELLRLFVHKAELAHFFLARSATEWKTWIETNTQRRANNIMSILMKNTSKPEYLPFIVKEWERAVALPELHYTFPNKNVDGLSHLYNWIRWIKDRVFYFGDKFPDHVRSGGALYPSYRVQYQTTLMKYIMEDYSLHFLA
ncbi:unnamed protein product [Albugo candida]|uniref:Prolyl 4-hydroxylase alpha subunit domain-containing protein n=1 Tax=Albugo candida TaxID=65357 RepID=A0A024GDB3_9STRA|nr:unnamed protein product [Albugo candida]|eukprot:CCI44678.1 unnamed protein product [Albugo candida]